MKKLSKSVSPFIMLLIPALLIIGFQAITSTEISEENVQASTYFQLPALKNLINTFCSY